MCLGLAVLKEVRGVRVKHLEMLWLVLSDIWRQGNQCFFLDILFAQYVAFVFWQATCKRLLMLL